MVAGTYKTLYGSVAGGLIYATKFLLGSLNFSKNQIPQDPVSVEGKFNNHIEIAFKKIEEWKEKYDIGCEIFLAFGTNSNETIEFGQETIIGGEDKGIFLKNLKTENISIFEKLADDLTKEKILVTNEYGENLPYDYSKKLQDSCKGNTRVVLTYQSLSWNNKKKKSNKQEHYSFWLPKEQKGKSNRILVFDYQEREYEEDLKKIKQWQSDNGNCEITLLVDGTESIRINDIETNPYNFFGSSLFVKDITPSEGGSKISKFEKLARDLESKKIQLTNEYGESLPYDYSKKLKDACSNNKITLTLQSLNWTPNGKPKEQHSFWLPKEQNSNNRSLIFNYQERDYLPFLKKIQDWQTANGSCEITLYIDKNESIKVSDIASNPHKYLGSELFVKNITKDGKSISKFEKLANDLAQERFEVLDQVGEKLDYNYSEKLKDACKSSSLILSLKEVKWKVKNQSEQQSYTFWLPKDETDIQTLVHNFLKREYEAPLAKIKKWKEDNENCEITLLFDSKSLKISDFENKPTDHLGSSIFTRDFEDKYSNTKISKFEKLANDLEKRKIKLINQYGENLDYSYSKKIKDACKNNQVTLTFKEVKWTDKASKKEQKHSFWIPESEKESDNNTIIFNYQEREYKESLEKIEKWKEENNNCEITLVLDSGLLEGASVTISEILEKPEENLWSPVFVEHLAAEPRDNKSSETKISSFERLANDLSTGKIEIINNFSETLKYDYSEKIKYSCQKNNQSVTLTYQEVSWSVGGRQHTYHFWLPQGETGNRTLVFDFQERDYSESLQKIKKWQGDNGNCEITLLIDNEYISIKDFSDDPHKFLGSELFAKNLNPDERDNDGSGKKISRFDRLARDLEMEKMSVTDEFSESLDFEYSQKLKDLCNKNKNSITLALSTISWTDKVNSKNHKLNLWISNSHKNDEDKKTAVFTYLKRDYETATTKVKEWSEMDGAEKCEIKLTISSAKGWYATMSDILKNPRGYVGAGLFTKELTRTVIKDGVKVTERYSKMEKIAEELFSKTIKITDEHGEEYNYDYSKKIRDICKESENKTATLAYLKSEWIDQVNNKKYELSFWHPKDKTTIDLIFNYLDRDYNTPIQKIKKWEEENDCEIEIVLKQDENQTVTTTQILENPNKYLGLGIFDKKIFIKDKDETQDKYVKDVTTKYSQMEKLAKDLTDKKVEILNSNGETAHFYYSEGLKAACKDNNKKVKVYWRKVKLTDVSTRVDRWYQYWTWEEIKNQDSPSWLAKNIKTPAEIAKEQREKAQTTNSFETLI